ncbi:DUF4062 domain-containing protein [Vibrio parahaemolyticus]|uniref:DUF4062 domain-containing protein n=2 Tax=Vibrionaceae TaxID=641 RepID=UPI000F0B38AC|nr:MULTISPECIES: DUF4062 domain-containing protein [Vibrio]ELA8098846.1 DUF4062 domain-containing protein [Vibrio parahaemolyticus]ELB2152590.1 DUF4062 domain-containing protein [Vibrio parahaemolyticus]MBE3757256.1 DUF4062 domain-containing protein [Vibrio parahaemolyticus]MBN8035051.1 DUF4062 domain-containing protein [Vibrio vulnificus]MDF4345733.1 DUF4062 domain-containing protein [Vibrio parahaemolyticus]
MDKRYQVFVSSTYADLKEERQHVIQALMEMDCIPAGMELFPAADEEQWEFIKKVIDDCDYYLLVIGGRYGSTTDDGISYTEKEFDYAVEQGLKVVALIHGAPEDIPFGKSEKDPELREKLLAFKDKVMTGRLVKFWQAASELPGLVALSLTKTIKMYPAVGWVRANHVASEDILSDINNLRKENSELKNTVNELSSQQTYAVENIADIDSEFTVNGTYYAKRQGYSQSSKHKFSSTITWRDLFALISPYIVEHPNDGIVKSKIASSLLEREGKSGTTISINDQEFKTITIQLEAYGLISTSYNKTTQGGMALFWRLTKKGKQLMIESRVVK